jgi:Fe-S cluster assembly protein SufD
MAQVAQLDAYLAAFTDFARDTAGSPEWLRDLRNSAFARFSSTGFPTLRDEDWRFTSLAPLTRTAFRLARGSDHPFTVSDLVQWRMEGAAARLVFVDGRLEPALSNWAALPRGVTVNGLAREIAAQPHTLATHFGRYLDIDRDPFAALNTAFAEDGAYIHISRGVVLEQPIHLLFVSTAGSSPAMTHPRNLIVVEDEGQATIIEDYVSHGDSTPAFSNAVTELVAGGSANVQHIMIEREHLQTFNFSTLRIEQARSANVASHSLLLGGALVRNNVHPVLHGQGGECMINGLFIGSARQHLDNYMLVEHASPHCASRQFYNGILDQQAHGVFHGRIVVHKDAQKTDAKQTNRNLLLNDDAQIDTKPQLEIYADDVKCTHGATIGQIEENALFYLRSRGLGEMEARRLLLEAFAGECIERMKPGAAREYTESIVFERLLSVANSVSSAKSGASGQRERNWEEVG